MEPRVGLLKKTQTGARYLGGELQRKKKGAFEGFWKGRSEKRKRKEEEGGVADHQVRRPWAWTASA